MKPLVSIILPVYGVEAYFETCMDSVCGQTIKELEIILVDDGSPDRCPELCDRFGAEDDRVRVIHQKNAGVSVARNVGLELAQAEWIMFADPDDTLERDAVERLYRVCSDTGCDVVLGGYREHYMDQLTLKAAGTGEVFQYPGGEYREALLRACLASPFRNPQRFPEEMRGCPIFASPWGKLFRAEFLRQARLKFLPGLPLHEDMLFNLQVCAQARQICFADVPVYRYRMRKESAIASARSDQHRRIIQAFEALDSFLTEQFPSLTAEIPIISVVDILRLVERYAGNLYSPEDEEQYVGCLEELLEHRGIRQAIAAVDQGQVRKRSYHPVLALLKQGDCRGALVCSAEEHKRETSSPFKQRFP